MGRNILILSILLLAGCANVAPFSDIFKKPTGSSVLSQKAETLESQGNYLESANEYLRLARSVSASERPRYQLAAIRVLCKANMINEAKAEMVKVNISQNPSLEPYFQLVQTQLILLEGETDRAFLQLQTIDSKTLPFDLQKLYHELRIQILESKGDFLNAVIRRVQMDYSLNTKEKSDNQERLWKSLTQMREQQLQNAFKDDVSDLSGWIALALLYKTTSSQDFQQAISKWQARYPTHPALQGLVQNLKRSASTLSSPSSNLKRRQIALLLPFNSRRQSYAEAIYRGFMAGNYASGDTATVKIYDEDPNMIAQTYQRALNEGANFVVGPLQKESIDALLNSRIHIEVPTLCLNHSENAPIQQNLYQFSLSPEDEAHSIAMKMWEDGYRASIVLAPSGQGLGERVLNAFQSLWTQRGGRLVMTEFYGKQVGQSAQKILQYQSMFDSIFMIASPKYGREFQAFLSNNAPNIPVYSMSHIYSGENTQENVELEGIIFGDMPWRIAPSQKARQLQSNFQMTWPESIPEFSKEYAFGIDAYHLLSLITHPSNARFSFQWDGQTGRLTMDKNGVIHRQWMHWAKFINGAPQLLNSNAPNPDDSTLPDIIQQESLIREVNELPFQ